MDDEMIPCVPPTCPDEVETFVYTCPERAPAKPDGVFERLDVPPGTVLVYRSGGPEMGDTELADLGHEIQKAVGHDKFVLVAVSAGADLFTLTAEELRSIATIAETGQSETE